MVNFILRVAMAYRYNERSTATEDCDLWLRPASDKLRIKKIDAVLLKYRVHPASITVTYNQREPERKFFRCKARCLYDQVRKGKFSSFNFKVLKYLILGGEHFLGKHAKDFAKDCLFNIGKLVAYLPLKNPTSMFFFFPFWHIGGAEKVHTDILAAVSERVPWVFITNKSDNDVFSAGFRRAAKVFKLKTENKFLRVIFRGLISTLINRHPTPIVFGANSPFFYSLIPLLKTDSVIIDLLHAFGGGLEDVSLPVVSRLNTRVVISANTIQDLASQYLCHGIDPQLTKRIILIENATEIPSRYPEKKRGDRLRIIYVGRGTEEKRAHLIGQAAAKCHGLDLPVEFLFAGPGLQKVEAVYNRYASFLGVVVDEEQRQKLYTESDILVLTSSREGFPLVIMEAMAHGVVPVCSEVGGISAHVIDGITGILINQKEEEEIVKSLVAAITLLEKERNLLARLSHSAYEHAASHFNSARFRDAYRNLLLGR